MSQAKLNVSDLRGRQVSLGLGEKALTFTIPDGPPGDEEEVQDFLELAARVEIALDPHVAIVKLGQGVIRQLDQDVRDYEKKKIRGDKDVDAPTLFTVADMAEKPAEKEPAAEGAD